MHREVADVVVAIWIGEPLDKVLALRNRVWANEGERHDRTIVYLVIESLADEGIELFEWLNARANDDHLLLFVMNNIADELHYCRELLVDL